MLRRLMRDERGFTLVELLIVMVILAILAMVAVPRFIDMREDARASSCRATQASLKTAIELYIYYNTMDSTNFPMPAATLAAWNGALTGTYTYSGQTVGPFLSQDAECPSKGNITISSNYEVKCDISAHQ